MNPMDDAIFRLIREFAADRGLPPTPSAEAMRAYLSGPGQLQVGSALVPQTGTVWFRPLKGGRWYVDRVV